MDEPKMIRFEIPEVQGRQIQDWQAAVDWQLMRSKFEKGGNLILISYRGERGLRHVDFLPESGEAVPYYGTIAGAYDYRFTPEEAGKYLLTVINKGYSLFQDEPVPPFCLELDQPLRWLVPAENLLERFKAALLKKDEELVEREFTVWPDDIKKLEGWSYWGKAPSAYAWEFRPTSVGCLSWAEHLASGERLELADPDTF
jgi:hypothetical protein